MKPIEEKLKSKSGRQLRLNSDPVIAHIIPAWLCKCSWRNYISSGQTEKCCSWRKIERERGRISEVVRQCSRFVPRTILEQVKQLIGPKVSSRVACKINKQKDFNARSKDKDQGLSTVGGAGHTESDKAHWVEWPQNGTINNRAKSIEVLEQTMGRPSRWPALMKAPKRKKGIQKLLMLLMVLLLPLPQLDNGPETSLI